MPALSGGCHSGALAVRLETTLLPAELPVRACQCSFCRRHAALSTSDPKGRVLVEARDPAALVRYRFGLGITDFLICGRCGVFVAALMEQDGGAWAVVNLHALEERDAFTQPPAPMDYDGEDPAARRQRRRARWTPARLTVARPPAPPVSPSTAS
jgi:hypothetical protein